MKESQADMIIAALCVIIGQLASGNYRIGAFIVALLFVFFAWWQELRQ